MNKEFLNRDGKDIALYVYDDVEKIKGVVKIAHGMAEHVGRYADFARFLNENGYVVVLSDMRGHGASAEKDSLGYEEGDMFANDVADQLAIVDALKSRYGVKVCLFGHSYGSFVTQAAMEQGCKADCYVLSGSNYIKGASFTLCRIVAGNICRSKGGRTPAKLIAKLSFSSYDKKFGGTNNWLTRNGDVVKEYNSDPMCGFICSANFYRAFMKGVRYLYKKENYVALNRDAAVYLVAGSDDPVGNFGKGVRKLYKFYRDKAKIAEGKLLMDIVPDARHELLNETNRSDNYQMLLAYFDKFLAE